MDGIAQLATEDAVGFDSWPFFQRQFSPERGFNSISAGRVSVELSLATTSSDASRARANWLQASGSEIGRTGNAEAGGGMGSWYRDNAEASHGNASGYCDRISVLEPSISAALPTGNIHEGQQPEKGMPFSFNFMLPRSEKDGDSLERIMSDGCCSSHPMYSLESTRGSEKLEDTELLALKLGGNLFSHAKEGDLLSDPAQFRLSQHPQCQVDDCSTDLTNAKDYHRRHKVCAVHAKALEASVAHSMQRFCQQCSRFHPLQEFDENKRSCRRRLAGHNKRRRKTQLDAAVSLLSSGDPVSSIVKILAQLQGKDDLEKLSLMLSGADELVQCLKKVRSFPLENFNSRNMEAQNTESAVQHFKTNSVPTELVGQGSTSVEATDLQAQDISYPSKTLLHSEVSQLMQTVGNVTRATSVLTGSDGHLRHSNLDHYQSSLSTSAEQVKASEILLSSRHVTGAGNSLGSREVTWENALGLSSAEQNGSLSWVPASSQCGESNNIIVRKENDTDLIKPRDYEMPAVSISNLGPVATGSSDLPFWYQPSNLHEPPLKETNKNSDSRSEQRLTNSDPDLQERTDRIVFKLFDRNPEEIPPSLQEQIFNWLAQQPSEMESYIRPGCVILTIFLSMQTSSWKKLSMDIKENLLRLIKTESCEFWSIGRILFQIGQKIAFIAEGNIQVNRFLEPVYVPQLLFVQPFAVVMGETVELLVKGHNLQASDTRMICVYRGVHINKKLSFSGEEQRKRKRCIESGQVLSSQNEEDAQEEETISFQVGPFDGPGRCFIEVERHALGCKPFPVIIADSAICEEICTLEKEFKLASVNGGRMSGERGGNLEADQSRVKADATHFLNELGWLFERSQWEACQSAREKHSSPKFSSVRFRWLLSYAVEHSWCAILKQVLDFMFSIGFSPKEVIRREAIETLLSDLSLLHKAVKMNSRPMVELLLGYSPPGLAGAAHSSVFSPDMPGPGHLTPLHVAASMQDAAGMIDALTSGPIQKWWSAWTTVRDVTGKTPLAYSLAMGNYVYIQIIERKLFALKGLMKEDTNEAHSNYKPAHSTVELNAMGPRTGPIATAENTSKATHMVNNSLWSSKPWANKNLFHGPCRDYNLILAKPPYEMGGLKGSMYRTFTLSMLAVAAVCVCVCILLKGPPQVLYVRSPFTWESVKFGDI
eukprot:c26868_g1_i1 orf=481-3978(-)